MLELVEKEISMDVDTRWYGNASCILTVGTIMGVSFPVQVLHFSWNQKKTKKTELGQISFDSWSCRHVSGGQKISQMQVSWGYNCDGLLCRLPSFRAKFPITSCQLVPGPEYTLKSSVPGHIQAFGGRATWIWSYHLLN